MELNKYLRRDLEQSVSGTDRESMKVFAHRNVIAYFMFHHWGWYGLCYPRILNLSVSEEFQKQISISPFQYQKF